MLQVINHIRIEDNVAYVKAHGHLKAEMVARMHTDEGCSIEEVMEHYQLTASEVHASVLPTITIIKRYWILKKHRCVPK